MGTKLCTKCKQTKHISQFAKNSSKIDGLQDWCRECRNSYNNDYRKENKEYFKSYNREYYANNRDKINQYLKKYREDHLSHYIYIIFEDKALMYIGSCVDIVNRSSLHINCHSNIKNYMRLNKWSSIKYIDIGEYINSKQEREFIEHLLINECCPALNSKTSLKTLDDEVREEQLTSMGFEILDHMELFTTYKTNEEVDTYYIDENDIDDYVEDEYCYKNAFIDVIEEDTSNYLDRYI